MVNHSETVDLPRMYAQTRSTLDRRPKTSVLLYKCETKHCLTNSKHRHIHVGAKMSFLWPSKYAKMRFRPSIHRTPLGGSRRSQDPWSAGKVTPIPIGGDTPPHISPQSAPRFGGSAKNIFCRTSGPV